MLPTNKDENWRYANLRPLAKAKSDAVATPAAPHAPIALPAQLPDYERWVFIDGQYAAALSAPVANTCASLLDVSDAGEAFAIMLDSAIASEGVDFALARLNAAGGSKVLQVVYPTARAPTSNWFSSPLPARPAALRIRACRCMPAGTRRFASSSGT